MPKYTIHQINKHSDEYNYYNDTAIIDILLRRIICNPYMVNNLRNNIVQRNSPPENMVDNKRNSSEETKSEDIVEDIVPKRTHRLNDIKNTI